MPHRPRMRPFPRTLDASKRTIRPHGEACNQAAVVGVISTRSTSPPHVPFLEIAVSPPQWHSRLRPSVIVAWLLNVDLREFVWRARQYRFFPARRDRPLYEFWRFGHDPDELLIS